MLTIVQFSAHFIGAADLQVTPWVTQLHLLLLLAAFLGGLFHRDVVARPLLLALLSWHIIKFITDHNHP